MLVPHVSIKTIRNGNAVKRWHTRRMLTSDTVGEHTANVLAIVFILEPKPSRQLVFATLLHDTAEQWTGDVPATAKWRSARLKSACDELEHDMMQENMLKVPALSAEEALVLKWADMLDLLYRCLDELEVGNTTAAEVFDRGVDYLKNLNEHSVGSMLLEQLQKDRKNVKF